MRDRSVKYLGIAGARCGHSPSWAYVCKENRSKVGIPDPLQPGIVRMASPINQMVTIQAGNMAHVRVPTHVVNYPGNTRFCRLAPSRNKKKNATQEQYARNRASSNTNSTNVTRPSQIFWRRAVLTGSAATFELSA